MHLFFDMTLQNIFSCNPQWKVVANLPVKVHLASEQVLKPSLGNWMSYLGLITLSFMFLGRLKCSYLRIFEKICNSFVIKWAHFFLRCFFKFLKICYVVKISFNNCNTAIVFLSHHIESGFSCLL